MFKREVGALKGFEHEHLVQMLDYMAEEEAGRLNIVLEVVPGGTLEELIAKGAASLARLYAALAARTGPRTAPSPRPRAWARRHPPRREAAERAL
jgi:hypothetical protein